MQPRLDCRTQLFSRGHLELELVGAGSWSVQPQVSGIDHLHLAREWGLAIRTRQGECLRNGHSFVGEVVRVLVVGWRGLYFDGEGCGMRPLTDVAGTSGGGSDTTLQALRRGIYQGLEGVSECPNPGTSLDGHIPSLLRKYPPNHTSHSPAHHQTCTRDE